MVTRIEQATEQVRKGQREMFIVQRPKNASPVPGKANYDNVPRQTHRITTSDRTASVIFTLPRCFTVMVYSELSNYSAIEMQGVAMVAQ